MLRWHNASPSSLSWAFNLRLFFPVRVGTVVGGTCFYLARMCTRTFSPVMRISRTVEVEPLEEQTWTDL